jgi:hypothetical protein
MILYFVLDFNKIDQSGGDGPCPRPRRCQCGGNRFWSTDLYGGFCRIIAGVENTPLPVSELRLFYQSAANRLFSTATV